MRVVVDHAGRVLIPAQVRSKMALAPGAEMALEVGESSLTLTRVALGPKLVRRGRRLVVRPSVDPKTAPLLDVPGMVEEERGRGPRLP